MKLSKAKLIKLVKPQLNQLGYIDFKDSLSGYQGLFSKKIENGFYLTLGLIIHRHYDSAFTAEYYLSKTTRIASIWDDIPKESSERPSFLLTDAERSIYPEDEINVKGAYDIWWDGNNEKSVLDFLRVIELTEPRFINQIDLIKKINQSKEVNVLSNYSETVKNIVATNQAEGKYSFLPTKQVDEIPIIWFKASEKVLEENKGILNANTVKLLAADSYRQNQLDNC
jgi:hypothetical protein